MRRINEAIREVLSGHITGGLKDPRIGFVTVTSVDTSPDLRHARVYVSVLGEPADRERTLEGLQAARGVLQRYVGTELRMKNTPRLHFAHDDSVDKGMRIEELLKRELGEDA